VNPIIFGNNLAGDNLQTKIITGPRSDGKIELSDLNIALHECRQAWRNAGLPGNGLFLINVELFRDQGVDRPIGGVGGCENFLGMSTCRGIGYAFVADRHWTSSFDPNNQNLAHGIGNNISQKWLCCR
jgi:hypothetical protein